MGALFAPGLTSRRTPPERRSFRAHVHGCHPRRRHNRTAAATFVAGSSAAALDTPSPRMVAPSFNWKSP